MNYEPENDFENWLILIGFALLLIILAVATLYPLAK
jgi:hypothetical protein